MPTFEKRSLKEMNPADFEHTGIIILTFKTVIK